MKCLHRLGTVNGFCISCGEFIRRKQEHFNLNSCKFVKGDRIIPLDASVIGRDNERLAKVIFKDY